MKRIFQNKIFKTACGIVVACVIVVMVCDIIVSVNANSRTFNDVNKIPHSKYGLLLGTSPFWGNHYRNFYFENRISAAAELYHAAKLDSIIVSGGDYTKAGGYNEPIAMRDSLVAHGVPAERILLDYNGQRTLKSIANVRDIYHTDNITLISQKYHNERALYQADHLGINAVAYNAITPRKVSKLIKNRGREAFARTKLFYDLLTGED